VKYSTDRHDPISESQAPENLAALYKDLGDIKNDFRNKNLYDLLIPWLKRGSLLDIGCGAGHFLHLAKQKGLRITGLEPNPELIAISEKLYGRSSDILNIGIDQINRLGQRQYDNITMLDVLEHIQDDESLLRTLRGFLHAQGRLLILVPCYSHLYTTRDKKLGHYRRYGKAELIAKLTAADYTIIHYRFWNMLGYFAYGITEKLLQKDVAASLRSSGKKNWVQRFCSRSLDNWLRVVENHINFGFGLSFFCVATPRTAIPTSENPGTSKK